MKFEARTCIGTEADVCTTASRTCPDAKRKVSYSHGEPARKFQFDRYFYPVLVQGWQYREDGQHLGHDRPHGHVCKMFPGAHASTESKREVFNVVGFEGTIVVEESLGYERVWVGVLGFVVSHRPSKAGQDVSRRNVKARTKGSL